MNDPRALFTEAARGLATVVAAIPDDAWERPGLGVWSVRELVAHALRGVTTAEEYLGHPVEVATLNTPGEYFRAVVGLAGIHDAVAERGRADAARLGDDPAAVIAAVVDTVERVVPLVEAADLDQPVEVRGGSMPFGVYLQTRILELVAHTDDLCVATGHEPVATSELVRSAATTLIDAVDEGGVIVLRALLGRGRLPDDFNLFA